MDMNNYKCLDLKMNTFIYQLYSSHHKWDTHIVEAPFPDEDPVDKSIGAQTNSVMTLVLVLSAKVRRNE